MRSFIQSFSLSKEEAHTTVLLIGIRKEARSQVLHLSRNKRYTLTPEKLKWDKFKLTYKYLFTACDAQKQYKLGKGRANISAKKKPRWETEAPDFKQSCTITTADVG